MFNLEQFTGNLSRICVRMSQCLFSYILVLAKKPHLILGRKSTLTVTISVNMI